MRGPLRYLIGADADKVVGQAGVITEIPFDATRAPHEGSTVLYGNLLDETFDADTGKGKYGPYMRPSDTAEEWGEGQIDPNGAGWHRNIDDQIAKAKRLGIGVIEWDNPDSYLLPQVLDALHRTLSAGMLALAKNPLLVDGGAVRYIAHPAVIGAICEAGSGTCDGMQALRHQANKPNMPVWWVGNAGDRAWCLRRRGAIISGDYFEMGVTWCRSKNDYSESADILLPRAVGS